MAGPHLTDCGPWGTALPALAPLPEPTLPAPPPPPPQGASGQQLVGGVVGVQNRGSRTADLSCSDLASALDPVGRR